MKVDVWSDVICPWCWLGRARLAKAVAASPKRDEIEVVFRSYELDPSSPVDLDIPTTEMLKKKLGVGQAQLEAMHERIGGMGKEEGIDFQFSKTRTSNTFEAHQLIHFAAAHGKRTEMVDRLFKANHHDGIRIGDRPSLLDLAAEVGLVASDAAAALEAQTYAAAVRADEAEARKLGITGVPFFLIDGKKAISGAQTADVLARALT